MIPDAEGWPSSAEIERIEATFGDQSRPGAARSPRVVAREVRRPLVAASFAAMSVDAVLDLIETVELAWPVVYGEEMPDRIERDLLAASGGSLIDYVHMARLALTDWRDVAAIAERSRSGWRE